MENRRNVGETTLVTLICLWNHYKKTTLHYTFGLKYKGRIKQTNITQPPSIYFTPRSELAAMFFIDIWWYIYGCSNLCWVCLLEIGAVSVSWVLFHSQYKHIILVIQNMDQSKGHLQVLGFLPDKSLEKFMVRPFLQQICRTL